MVFCGGDFGNLGRDRSNEELPSQGRTPVSSAGGLRKPTSKDLGELQVFRFPRALRKLSLFLTTAPCVLFGYLWLKLTGRGPDLVHGHGHITCCFNIYKLLFGWLDRTSYVLHLHITAAGRASRTDHSELDFWTRFFEWPLHKFSDWLGVRVADRVICVSKSVRKEAIDYYGANPNELVVVENGVNTELFSPKSFRRQTSNYQLRNILYVGALRKRKNVHLLIEALKHLPESFQLTVVGRGSDDFEKKLCELAGDLKLEDRVVFRGYVEYSELPSIYRSAQLFVLPSSYEGLPKVVLEALASGVPVLASGFEIEEGIRGLEFLESLEPAALARKIHETIESGLRVDVSGVERLYSWEKKVGEIEAIYSLLIKS